MVLHSEWAQVEVIDLINDGSGLAFGIIGGRSTGVIVKTILPGGVADRDGRLKSGDHILQIGEVNLRGLGSEQVASVLRQCGVHVRMVVARPADATLLMAATTNGGDLGDQTALQSNSSTFAVVPTRVLGDPVELDRYLAAIGCTEVFSSGIPPYIYADHHEGVRIQVDNLGKDDQYVPVPFTTGAVIHDTAVNIFQDSNLPESEKYVVQLTKDNLGLGITVAGYVCEKEEISGIFVKSVSKGSAADLTKNIQNNDRIIEVNGVSVLGMTNHAAVKLLRQSGPSVKLTLERYLRGPKYERLQQAIRANEMRPPSPPSPTLTSLPKVPLSQVQMGFLSIEPDDLSRTSFEFDSAVLLEDDLTPVNEEKEIVIGNEKRSVQFFIQDQDFIYDRWKDRVKVDDEIVIARMHKGENSGLGISLEGTVDVENGKELRPHHYIRNILPDGPVGKDGTLQSGDELLEVNGVQLMGLNHLDVVSILKQLPNTVCLVCARHATPIQIIDTSQHKEAFQARKILAGSLHTLLASSDSRHHLEKAKSQSSLMSSNGDENTSHELENRSRSLDLIGEAPLWSEESTVVKLEKTDKGLGFSILDYQDPINPSEIVIVIRSIIPGGTADLEGTILPGDRLLKVNQIDVSRATLDHAVNVLKGASNGTVIIEVAKPIMLAGNGTISHGSEDTEDDQLTCLDDFQECIEDFQECLDTVHICIDGDDDLPFNHSPCTSTFEEYGRKSPKKKQNFIQDVDFLELGKEDQNFDSIETELTNFNKLHVENNIANDSDLDLSYKSINETIIKVENKKNLNKNGSCRADSLTHSDKDGYDTCIEESLSEDVTTKVKSGTIQSNFDEFKTEPHHTDKIERNNDHVKSTSQLLNLKKEEEKEKVLHLLGNKQVEPNGKAVAFVEDISVIEDPVHVTDEVGEIKMAQLCINPKATNLTAVSEPCLNIEISNARHICLDTKPMDNQLKSYDNSLDVLEEDEFFLVQYPTVGSNDVMKSYSEPNVLAEDSQNTQKFERSTKFKRRSYRKCLNEYYNDYQDCLEALGNLKSSRKSSIANAEQVLNLAEDKTTNIAEQRKEELSDDDIFNNIVLPIKNRSAPDILDTSFVTMTYDPGPYLEATRRKSAFVFGEQGYNEISDMTVIRPVDSESQAGYQFDNMLHKHWGSSHSVKVYREHGKSLGISIVGGKVDFTSTEKASDAFLGIFIKNVVPDSPAGKTGQFKTGDRILEVSGIDLRHATHETAVQAIRKADNPVTFVIQSLIPWKNDDSESNAIPARRQSTKSRAAPPPPAKSPSIKRASLKSPAPPPPESPTPNENIPSLIFSKDSDANKNTQSIQNHIPQEKPANQTPGQSPSPFETAPSISETLSDDETQKKKNETAAGSASESDSESEDDDVRELEGRTMSAKGQQIDRASAANVKRSKEEAKADPEEEDDFGYTMSEFSFD
ncbi:unnamed protein product [Acanthoscelides obtectus]|uniref:PDZ domain-containing protein n=2 Tax=Acanthoscelides obtectus TaxID=200917 RepID=A0A9P0MHH4_ACAOB|nr:unnamed protein product [Acanthoscelides obtectus]CAK1621415.1 Patj homolog [Acanthoscelides obtectus]